MESGEKGSEGTHKDGPVGAQGSQVSLLTLLFSPTRVSYCKTDKVLGHSVCHLGAQKLWQLPVAVTIPTNRFSKPGTLGAAVHLQGWT